MNTDELSIGITLENVGEIKEKIANVITALQELDEALSDGMKVGTDIPPIPIIPKLPKGGIINKDTSNNQ